MKKIILFHLALTLFSCNKTEIKADGAQDSTFEKLSEEYLKGYLDWRPSKGVVLGLHEYDGKTTDYSKASIAAEVVRLKDYDAKLAALDSASLSIKTYYDWKMLGSSIKKELFSFEDLKVRKKSCRLSIRLYGNFKQNTI